MSEYFEERKHELRITGNSAYRRLCPAGHKRLGFNGLHALVETVLKQDVLSGHLFLFTNKLRNRIRVLYWDGSGLWVCAKRLERSSFGWPVGEGASVCLRPEELQLLLHGIEGRPRRRWYRT